MRFCSLLGTTVLCSVLLAQESSSVSFCPRYPEWSWGDSAFVGLLFVFGILCVPGSRQFATWFRARTARFPWGRARRWVPGLMVASGWLAISTSDNLPALLIVWAIVNLPALVVASLLLSILSTLAEPLLWATGAIVVWLVWYGLIRWAEAKSTESTSLSIR